MPHLHSDTPDNLIHQTTGSSLSLHDRFSQTGSICTELPFGASGCARILELCGDALLQFELQQSKSDLETPVLFERAYLLKGSEPVLDNEAARTIIELATSPEIHELFRELLGQDRLLSMQISYLQVNRMQPGHFIETHAHPLALAAATVLQEPEDGGEHFVASGYRENQREFLELPPGCIIASRGNKPHGVTKVLGTRPRIALVWGVNCASQA